MSVYEYVSAGLTKLVNERNEALEELAKMRAAQAATSARAERLGQMVDLATEAMKWANDTARKVIAERDAALARAADSDARLVRAIDAAKAAALAALAAPGPAAEAAERRDGSVTIADLQLAVMRDIAEEAAHRSMFWPAVDDCDDDGLDSGDGLDAARKGRTTPSVRR